MKKTESTSKKKKAQTKTGRGSTLIWISLIFFVSAWMFLLGIFVGRGTVPVRFDIQGLQKELASLKEVVIKEGQKRLETGRDSADTKMKLDFYETLKETNTPAKHKAPSPVSKKKSLSGKTKKIPEKIRKSAAGNEKIKPETNGGFVIQVVSLKDLKAASGIAETLKKKGYQAYTVSVKIPEKGTWHRVRIGNFKTRKEAAGIVSSLKKNDYKPIIVKK